MRINFAANAGFKTGQNRRFRRDLDHLESSA